MDFIKGNEQVKIDPDGIDISGASNIVVKSDGKIGIGTNNPQHPLQVNGSPAIFSNNPEIQLFKEEAPGRLGSTLNWGTTGFTDWKIKAEDSGLKIMSGINNNTNEKLSLLNTGTIDISGDVSLNGDLSLNGTIDISGDMTINGDASFNKNVTISGGDLNIYDNNGNYILKSEKISPSNPSFVSVRSSTNYPGWPAHEATDDDDSSAWSCGDVANPGDIAEDRNALQGSGSFYSNKIARTSSVSAYTYFFYYNGQTTYGGTDDTDYAYGEWIQLEYSTPGIFKNFELKQTTHPNCPYKITILGSNTGTGYTEENPPVWYRVFDHDNLPYENSKKTYGPNFFMITPGSDYRTWDYTYQPFKYFRVIVRQTHGADHSRIYGFKINFHSISNYIDIPILFSRDIQSSRVLVTSDSRIKNDITIVDDTKAIDLVNTLESKEYGYIDPYNKKTQKTIGFIAQEVKDVLPNAVSIQKGFIPDEIRVILNPVWNASTDGTWTLTISDIVFQSNHTGKCRFYFGETKKDIQVESDRVSFKFDRKWNNVYLWGKEINDFHMIDKNQIFALHHSAIQELDRKHKREVEEKDNKISTLEHKVDSLTARLEALESSVLSLQNN